MRLLIESHPFPCLRVFAHFVRATEICFEAQEHYQKGSYRNRYHIAGPNGLQRLSIPLVGGKHNATKIPEVEIAYTEPWAQEHWRSIQTAYGKSPFFIHYADELKELIFQEAETLWEWNWQTICWALEQVGVDVKLNTTSAYQKKPANYHDVRNRFSPKSREEEILPAYPQVFTEKNGFLGNLSILDLLFCQGPLAIQYLENLNLEINDVNF